MTYPGNIAKVVLPAVLILIGCRNAGKDEGKLSWNAPAPRETIESDSLRIPVYDFDGLEPLLHREDNTIYVLNFWATWCTPCVKELPNFEKLAAAGRPEGVQVILVNLDMPGMWESHLIPFVREHKLTAHVVVLDDPRQNDWIPRVDEGWSGTIPATLIYRRGKRRFYQQPFTYEELQQALTDFKS